MLVQPLLSGPEISGFLSSVSSSPKAALVLLLGQDFLPLPMEGLTVRDWRPTRTAVTLTAHTRDTQAAMYNQICTMHVDT